MSAALTSPVLARAAAPGQGDRLVGPQAQGPATAAVSALHHNPAMLAALPGLQLSIASRGGVDIISRAGFSVDERGRPFGETDRRTTMINPALGYFIGVSYQLEPVAIGVGVYDLSSRLQPWSSPSARYQLAPDPDVGCVFDPQQACPKEAPRNGGAQEIRTDYTLAIAWSILDRLQVGAAFHVPRLRVHLSRDHDTRLMPDNAGDWVCPIDDAAVGDPRCAERLSFTGRSRLRWFGLAREEGTRFDFITTFGVAIQLAPHGRLGLRYRTRPWLDRGQLDVVGNARVCRSEEAVEAAPGGLPVCAVTPTVQARLSAPIPREFAVGVAWEFGDRERWHLDSNLYWIDSCPGGTRIDECDHRDARHLTLVGLSSEAAVLPELELYRGRQDIFGGQVFTQYDIWKTTGGRRQQDAVPPRVSITVGAGVRSPGARRGAMTVTDPDGWVVSADLGPRIELVRRHGSWILLPGYGVDVLLPTRIGPGGAAPAFDPSAALDFAASGSDIHAPSADAVLHGRAQATNAGIYSGSAHVLMFALRWSDRG